MDKVMDQQQNLLVKLETIYRALLMKFVDFVHVLVFPIGLAQFLDETRSFLLGKTLLEKNLLLQFSGQSMNHLHKFYFRVVPFILAQQITA